MDQKEKVQLNLLLPICQRDKLRKMAAEMNLGNPARVITAAAIAKEIICEHLDQFESGQICGTAIKINNDNNVNDITGQAELKKEVQTSDK